MGEASPPPLAGPREDLLARAAGAARGRDAPGYVPTLDGWRALAVLGVMICHFTDPIFLPGGPLPSALLHRLSRLGAEGVNVFFGISGYLICSRLLAEARTGAISLRSFYLRRAFRILPPYYAYLAFLALLAATTPIVVGRNEWLACLLFYRNYVRTWDASTWYTAHFWSLAVEEHFYLLWPSLLALLGARRARPAALWLALAIAAWRVIDARLGLVQGLLPGVGAYVRTDLCLDGLLWGCAYALAFESQAAKERLRRWLPPAALPLLVIVFLGLAWYQPPLTRLWRGALVPLLLLATVLRPEGAAGGLLETAPLRWLGRLSYSLYVWQQVFLASSEVPRPFPLGPLQHLPLNLVCAFALACASYYLLERPLQRAGHRIAHRLDRRWRQAPPPASIRPVPASLA